MSTPPPPPPPPGQPPHDQWQEPAYQEEYYPTEHIPAEKEGYWRKMGGGSLSISIAAHVVLILIALFWFFTTYTPTEKQVDFVPGGGGGGGGGQKKAAQKRMRAVTQAAPRTRLASSATSPNAISLPDVSSTLTDMSTLTSNPLAGGGLGSGMGSGRGTGSGSGVGSGIGSGFGPGSGAGFISLPKIYSSRCSPAEREQKMKANGGSPECEAAVRKSLAWLKTKQNSDGSWGQGHKAAMTGLALLAYLGHCETPESVVYGETVTKGITYLINLGTSQKEKQFEGIFSEAPEQIKSSYEHGIATYALGEVYSFAKLGKKELPGLRDAFEKGVEVIIEKQNGAGSWSYKAGIGYSVDDRNDLSVTGWQFQALKAAKHTNLKIKGLAQATKKVEDYLKSTQTPDGGFGTTKRDAPYSQWTLTGAGMLGLQTLGGGGNTGAINKAARWLQDDLKNSPPNWNYGCYLYTWYYNTQAAFQKGGELWETWNTLFQKQVLDNQLDDGSWRPETGGPEGAATTSAAGADANIYRATMCTLMLEVYYRYLKVGGREDRTSGLIPVIK